MKKSKIYRTDVHFGYKVPKYDTNDIFDKAITTEKLDEGAVSWNNLSVDVQNIIASRGGGGGAVITDEEMDNVLGGDEERYVYLVDINGVEILDANDIPIVVLA